MKRERVIFTEAEKERIRQVLRNNAKPSFIKQCMKENLGMVELVKKYGLIEDDWRKLRQIKTYSSKSKPYFGRLCVPDTVQIARTLDINFSGVNRRFCLSGTRRSLFWAQGCQIFEPTFRAWNYAPGCTPPPGRITGHRRRKKKNSLGYCGFAARDPDETFDRACCSGLKF